MDYQNRYRIFWVENASDYKHDSNIKKNQVKTFYANSNDEAYKLLEEFKRTTNDGHTYYYELFNKIKIIDDNNIVEEYESFDDVAKIHSMKTSTIKKFFEKIYDWFDYWFIDKPRCIFRSIKDYIFLVRTKHNRNESWSLDYHILDDILFNVPILIKDKHGIATNWLEKAHEQLTAEKLDSNMHNFSNEEQKIAIELQTKAFENLIEYVRCYMYFQNFGIEDGNYGEAWYKSHRNLLPYVPGTYNSFDYIKMHELEQEYWNKIWEWMRQYGQTLWD